jgi:hypothetical protein
MLRSRFPWVMAALGLVLLVACATEACNTPVFRVALIDPKWRPERYEFTLFQKGPLGEKDKAIVKGFNDYLDAQDGHVNCQLEVIDLDRKPPKESRDLLQKQGAPECSLFGFPANLTLVPSYNDVPLPYLVVRHPEVQDVRPNLWAGPLHEAPLRALLESPARAAMSQRILAGQSAVWLLLESGNQVKDDAALTLLTTEIEKLQKSLKLPELKPGEDSKYDREGAPPVKLEFSSICLARQDPAEKWLIEMLLLTEADLKASREPMVFPVYGRGIALYALVGKGINEKTIKTAAQFIVGECACEVRRENPGKDLLMVAPWETNRPLPALANLLFMPTQPESGAATGRPSGASAEAVTVPPVEEAGKESRDIGAVDTETRLIVNIAAGLAVGLLVIVACGILYVARSRA